MKIRQYSEVTWDVQVQVEASPQWYIFAEHMSKEQAKVYATVLAGNPIIWAVKIVATQVEEVGQEMIKYSPMMSQQGT